MQTFKIKKKFDGKMNLKLKAGSHEIRRLLLGLIFTNGGPIYHSDILQHIQISSNKLAYHLNILYDANLIDRSYERHGSRYAKYSITEDGEKFLNFIGANDELKNLTVNRH